MHENELSPQIKRVQSWIERLENKATTLLDGLSVEEMSPKHQADIALKCLDHLQRLTAIEKKLQDASQAGENQSLLSAFKRQARGEQEPPRDHTNQQEEEEHPLQCPEDEAYKLEDEEWQEHWWSADDEEQEEEEHWHEEQWWNGKAELWDGC